MWLWGLILVEVEQVGLRLGGVLSGWGYGRRGGRETEVVEDLLDDVCLRDEGDDEHLCVAARAVESVYTEGTLEESGPGQAPGSDIRGHCESRLGLGWWSNYGPGVNASVAKTRRPSPGIRGARDERGCLRRLFPGEPVQVDVSAGDDDAHGQPLQIHSVFEQHRQGDGRGGLDDDLHALPYEPHGPHDGLFAHGDDALMSSPRTSGPDVVYERTPGAASAALPPRYRPRRPEAQPLYRVVSSHLETLLAEPIAHGAAPYPRYVEREFRRYLTCSIPAHGFYRVRCPDCGHERLLGLSCAGRLCPSCWARRMADGAAHLVDRVLPAVPYRQLVLSLPYRLRFHLARDGRFLSQMLGAYLQSVFAWQRSRGCAEDASRAQFTFSIPTATPTPACREGRHLDYDCPSTPLSRP